MDSARVLDEVLELVMDAAIDATGAERGFIMLATPERELEFKIGRAKGRVTLSGTSFATSQKDSAAGVFDRPRADRRRPDGRAAGRRPLGNGGARHPQRAVHPVEGRALSRPVGRLGRPSADWRDVSRQPRRDLLSAASRSALETVATEAASAIESARLYREEAEKARLENELRLAAEIQRALLPDADQSGAHFDVAAASMPCRAIGGDFFDYFHLPSGAFGFALGDVAGKGPPAALLTAMIQGVFSAQVVSAASPAQLMATVNASLIRRSIQNRFATVLYGALSPDGRLIYSNAGHNPPVLIKRDGVQRLETGGLIVGLFPQAEYDEETLQLEDGDVLVVFSDGVTEAFNAAGEEFGEARLLACLEAHRDAAPADVLKRVLSSVREFTASAAQSDDVTALVLQV